VFVGADCKDYNRNVTEAEGEVALGIVILSGGLTTFKNSGDEGKGPELAAEKTY